MGYKPQTMKLLICIALCCATLPMQPQHAQDTVTEAPPPVAAMVADTTHTPRSFRESFGESYRGSDFEYEPKKKPETMWDRFWKWVREVVDSVFGGSGDGKKAASAFDIMVKIVAFAVIGFAVYMVARLLLGKKGWWIFGRSTRIASADVHEDSIHQADFRDLIANTKNAGNYRLAIRYYYLWLLKKLSANAVIDWHRDKTNSDYLNEIGNASLKKDFGYLSYVYDYIWYGDFPIDDAAFAKAENAFLKTINTL